MHIYQIETPAKTVTVNGRHVLLQMNATPWKSVFDNSDAFFNSHPAFQSTRHTDHQQQHWNSALLNTDNRIEFDRHVLESVQHTTTMSDILSQPSRSPRRSLYLKRPETTPPSKSEVTKYTHAHRKLHLNGSTASVHSTSSTNTNTSRSSSRSSSSSGASSNFSFGPTTSPRQRRNGIADKGVASNHTVSEWSTLSHQTHNRLKRMKADLKTIPEKVIKSVQEKELPLHSKTTSVLMNKLKTLKSTRCALEKEIPLIINIVRAQKQPEDCFTRCWDPATGVKMKVQDIENALKKLEQDIVDVKIPETREIKMKKIYIHMKRRYVSETSVLAAQVKEIRHVLRTHKMEKRLNLTSLTDILDANASIEKEVLRCEEKKQVKRMTYQRALIALDTEQKEQVEMLKMNILGMDRRQKIQKEQRENKYWSQITIHSTIL